MSETGVPKEVAEIRDALTSLGGYAQSFKYPAVAQIQRHGLEALAAIERQLRASQEGRGREVRAMQAFIEAIWHKVMCSGETFEQAQDALVKAWTALDKSLGVWYWDHQPGALKPSIAPSGQPAVLPSGDPERSPT